MKNGDIPITPITIFDSGENSLSSITHLGLTKREHFASLALQGILAHPNISFGTDSDKRLLIRHAVKYADGLLKELEDSHEQ